MSLQQTIATLKANDLKQARNVVLIHLSRQNADPEQFRQEVELATGKRVTIAQKGIEINLNKTPFE